MADDSGLYFYLAPLAISDCEHWVNLAVWSAFEATLLSMGFDPNSDDPTIAKSEASKIAKEYEKRAEMVKRSQYGPEINKAPIRVTSDQSDSCPWGGAIVYPAPFTRWAKKNFRSFHGELYDAMVMKYPSEFLPDPEPKKNEPQLRNSQKAREHCRVVAEMLWDQDETIKTKEMIVRPEMVKYGSRGAYEPKAVYNWIKDLAPKNRNRGGAITDSKE